MYPVPEVEGGAAYSTGGITKLYALSGIDGLWPKHAPLASLQCYLCVYRGIRLQRRRAGEHRKSMAQYSVLDLCSVREGSDAAESFRNSLDLARHAERWGYTRFWLAEHHNMDGIASSATSVLVGYIAGGTDTIRVGSGGVMLPNHAALIVAEHYGTLATLYPGRIDLGVGRAPGSDRVTANALGRSLDREEDFPQQVRELLGYLGPERPGQTVRAIPGQGTNVPVWLLGSSTYSAQLAAAMGLPFAFAAHFAPQDMVEALLLYRRSFQPSKFLAEPWSAVGIPLVAADTDEKARRIATSLYLRFLRMIRGQRLVTPPPVDSMDGLWTPQERAAVEMRLGAAIVGAPETVEAKLARLLRDVEVDEVIFVSDLFFHPDRLRSYEIAMEAMKRVGEVRAPHAF
ncbi:MAG: class flavin-dependent oxidoreductase [Candidatus Solibacter sp.]|nr:class flavin-dependent oxidoreductase [Candidatus Solibacter sp.]